DANHRHDQFVERFVRSQDRIYAYVVTLLPNRADAEEVFQQTCLALWTKWDQFDPARDFVSWACGMAHYEARNFLRKTADRGRVQLSEDVLSEVARTRLDAHDALEERRQALQKCLAGLQPAQRELLDRCYAGAESIREIAGQRGEPPNALYMTLKRLRRALFDCINLTLAREGTT